MSDMQEWPDLSDCACGGSPGRSSATMGPPRHTIICQAVDRSEDGCARRASGITRAEAAAGWNGIQAEAWQSIASATLEIPAVRNPEYARGHHDGYAQGLRHGAKGFGTEDRKHAS